ncbi:hypothetical protein [Pseudomonas sp. RGM2987]|uniref:hypothetical protein n=1 Tax=Pseudomonas sp. RGM2987 TaxID=2930090 RepID=UPI001FD637E3|nr:hypothetical protein [Pseudomonas sp. RGM2987]MCJ8207508.1 hypothetical protein [Pseudomonas sp. RGM2987]
MMTIRFLGNVDPDAADTSFLVGLLACFIINIALCRSLYFDGYLALTVRVSAENVSPKNLPEAVTPDCLGSADQPVAVAAKSDLILSMT